MNIEIHNPACEFVLNSCVVHQKREQLTHSSHHSHKLPVFEAVWQRSAGLEGKHTSIHALTCNSVVAMMSLINLRDGEGGAALEMLTSLTPG